MSVGWGDWLRRPSPKHDAANWEPCDLCGGGIPPDEMNEAAFEVSGLNVCTNCIETELEASCASH